MLEAALSTSPLVTRLQLGAPRAPPEACVESAPGSAERAVPGSFAPQFQTIGEMNPLQTT